MNSRLKKGCMTYDTKDKIINEVNSWISNGEIASIYDINDKYISYESTDGLLIFERRIYFPETDNVNRIKEIMVYDDKVKEYINPDKLAEFIYNCIDVNALAVVKGIALLYDEPILDTDGDIEDYEKTAGREALMNLVADGCDEYAYEIGIGQLGVTWVEHSAVIINIGELVKTSKEISDEYGDDFKDVFEEGLIQTICHEFRHLFYECNEFTPIGEGTLYPSDGGKEFFVEQYGNNEAWKLLNCMSEAMSYIEDISTPLQLDKDEEIEMEL